MPLPGVIITTTKAQVITDIEFIDNNGVNTAGEVRTPMYDLMNYTDTQVDFVHKEVVAANDLIDEIKEKQEEIETDLSSVQTSITTIHSEQQVQDNRLDDLEEGITGAGIFSVFDEEPIKADEGEVYFWYSIHGFKERFINLTFCLHSMTHRNTLHTKLSFLLPGHVADAFASVVRARWNDRRLSYVVSSTNRNKNDEKKVWSMDLEYIVKGPQKFLVLTLTPTVEQKEGDREFLEEGDDIFTSICVHTSPFKFDVTQGK